MTTELNTDSTLIDLKTARENSGLTLKELFERTRISVVNLEAIENGDWHLLPVPIYTRNFIKTYADALGVDGKPVLQRYDHYQQALQMKEKEQTTEQPPNAPLIVILSRHKASLWVVGIIIVVAAISFFVSIYNKPSPEAPQQAVSSPKAVITEPQTQNMAEPDHFPVTADLPKPGNLITINQTNKEQIQPAEKSAEAPTLGAAIPAATPKDKKPKAETVYHEEPSVLIVHATEKTWIRIQADDKESFQVLLNPGDEISHKAARFNMDIGNAGGIRIRFDGKSIENLGKSGQVIHLRLP